MNIAITGANGFLGKNLIYKIINKKNIKINKITRKTKKKELEKILLESKIIFHFAGVNRSKNKKNFIIDNIDYTKYMCDFLKKNNKKSKIVFTSSTQITSKSDYGKSKLICEKILIKHAKINNSKISIFRLPNVFGKWSKPNYNSVVSTFCNNIARNKKVFISDPKKNISLVYIDDLIDSFVEIINKDISKNKIFYEAYPVKKITLNELFLIISNFEKSRKKCFISDFNDSFNKKLYSTFISFLPKSKFTYPLVAKKDKRGSFIEFLKNDNIGQISVFIAKKNTTRGKHFHHTKVEKFLVVKGSAKFKLRNMANNDSAEFKLDYKNPKVIESIPGWTHSIQNSGKDDLIVLLWSNEVFNAKKPDTIYHD